MEYFIRDFTCICMEYHICNVNNCISFFLMLFLHSNIFFFSKLLKRTLNAAVSLLGDAKLSQQEQALQHIDHLFLGTKI